MSPKKQFYAVINIDGDHFERVFASHEEASAYIIKRNNELEAKDLPRRLTRGFERVQWDFNTLDQCLEGEGTQKLWESVEC